jgi:hypothetical protein
MEVYACQLEKQQQQDLLGHKRQVGIAGHPLILIPLLAVVVFQ